MKKSIESRTEAVKEELKKPLPPHNPEKEKKVMATKKASKKKVSKKKEKVSKKVSKKDGAEKKEKKAKAGPVDGVTLKALADEAGISGQKARVKLRAAGINREKGGRWVFGEKSKDLKDARKALGLS